MAAGLENNHRLKETNGPDIHSITKRFHNLGRKLSERLEFPRAMSTLRGYASEHPIFSLILAIMALMCLLPILIFVCFVVATLGFTFMGFLFIEGTLLTVGTFLLSGVLFFVGFLALGFSAFVAATWIIMNKVLNVLNSASDRFGIKPKSRSALANGLHHID